MHPTALAALAWAFLPGPPTVPGSATRLLARVRPLSALDEVDPFELELERQSEVVEVLRRVSDPALSDLENAKKSSDIVSLGLLRDLQTGEGSVRLEFVVPQDAAASGAVDRLRVKCEALLQAELPGLRYRQQTRECKCPQMRDDTSNPKASPRRAENISPRPRRALSWLRRWHRHSVPFTAQLLRQHH